MYQAEPKMQRWRAIAVSTRGEESLICLGQSIVEVREYYTIPWFDLFDEEVRKQVAEIHIQRWKGVFDYGKWVDETTLPIPVAQSQVA